MTIIEAIKSGKAFKRVDWVRWLICYDMGCYPPCWEDAKNEDDGEYALWREDILADDWIVREE